uniref:Uncharacterized protein n=1 Tax=Avena sativa TaxID=4498 RepID=A0ACD5ZXM9_AVESA
MAPSVSIILALLLAVAATDAATITVINKCPYTVWPGATPLGGGTKLDPGQSSFFKAPASTQSIRIWGRTGCKFDANGQGSCTTGDCGGVLACKGGGKAPVSLAEITLGSSGASDFYDVLPRRRLQRSHELRPHRRQLPHSRLLRGHQRAMPVGAQGGRGLRERMSQVQYCAVLLPAAGYS